MGGVRSSGLAVYTRTPHSFDKQGGVTRYISVSFAYFAYILYFLAYGTR
jgi:hypothetical protein